MSDYQISQLILGLIAAFLLVPVILLRPRKAKKIRLKKRTKDYIALTRL